jgi:hypothetical protein
MRGAWSDPFLPVSWWYRACVHDTTTSVGWRCFTAGASWKPCPGIDLVGLDVVIGAGVVRLRRLTR